MASRRMYTILAGLLVALVTAIPASADIRNETRELSFNLFNPCANGGEGEIVAFSGVFHLVQSEVDNDNHYQLNTLFHLRGTAVGQETGTNYVVSQIRLPDPFGDNLLNGQTFELSIHHFQILGPGPGNNWTISQLFLVVESATGQVVTIQQSDERVCR